MNTPGATSSIPSSTSPKTTQDHAELAAMKSMMAMRAAPAANLGSCSALAVPARCRGPGRWTVALRCFAAKGFAGDLGDSAQSTDHAGGFHRQHQHLLIGGRGDLFEGFDVI